MRVQRISGRELSGELVAAWKAIQQADPALDSPFFRPEYTQAVAAVRSGVEVGILEHEGAAVGFLPYQRRRSVALPVGGPVCDFQPVVVRPDVAWNPEELVRGCGLRAWQFDHLLAGEQALVPYHWLRAPSPFIDLTGGFERYRESRRQAGSNELAQTLRKARKAERDLGPICLVPHTTERDVLATLLDWKSRQYRRTGLIDLFSFAWPVALLEVLLEHREPVFSPMVSALYLAGQLAAVHFGLRSGSVLHWWFFTYDRQFERFSPGLILLVKMAEAAESLGLKRFDLGKGPARYKQSFMTGETTVAEGCVDTSVVSRALRHQWLRTRELVRGSPLRRPVGRIYRNARAWLGYY